MAKPDILTSKTELPLIVAPMFLVSNPDMVVESCKNGAVGSFPSLNQMTNEGLDSWLTEIRTRLKKFEEDTPGKKAAPYAVNLIVNKTNKRLKDDLALCIKHEVPIIITSLGLVPEMIDQVHAYGGIIIHDVTNAEHAKKAIAAGVDGLITVSAGAGGHAGTTNPVTLVREIRKFYDGLLILAGGMTDGADILSAQALGADMVVMGTRFVATQESGADAGHKQMICDATSSSDIVYTAGVSGVPGNFLKKSLENAGLDVDALRKETVVSPQRLKDIKSEGKAWKQIWSAGQGVGNISDIPSLGDLVTSLKQQYAQAKIDFSQKLALGATQRPAGPKPPRP